MMLSAGRHEEAEKALNDALDICDSITEVMPEEAE